MIINHPLLGPRDSQEFVYLGDAALIDRPDWQAEGAVDLFHDYLYQRTNPAATAPSTSPVVMRPSRPRIARILRSNSSSSTVEEEFLISID